MLISFFGCLYIAAWQDYKSGSVSLALLLASVGVTLTICICAQIFNISSSIDPLHDNLIYAIVVFIPMLLLALMKKFGGADVIILTQTALIFGITGFIKIFMLSAVAGFVWVVAQWAADPTRSSLYEMRKKEIYFVPCIAFAASVVFVLNLFHLRGINL